MRLLLAYSLNSLNHSHGVSANCKNKKYEFACTLVRQVAAVCTTQLTEGGKLLKN